MHARDLPCLRATLRPRGPVPSRPSESGPRALSGLTQEKPATKSRPLLEKEFQRNTANLFVSFHMPVTSSPVSVSHRIPVRLAVNAYVYAVGTVGQR